MNWPWPYYDQVGFLRLEIDTFIFLKDVEVLSSHSNAIE